MFVEAMICSLYLLGIWEPYEEVYVPESQMLTSRSIFSPIEGTPHRAF